MNKECTSFMTALTNQHSTRVLRTPAEKGEKRERERSPVSRPGNLPVPVPPPYGQLPLLFVGLFDGDSTHHTRYARPLFPSCRAKLSTRTLI